MSGEWAAYWIARTLVAIAGLFFVFAAVRPIVLQTEIALQILGLALGLPVAGLMLCPNRLTVLGRRFRCRLVASLLVGLYLIVAGVGGLSFGLDGGHDPEMWGRLPMYLLHFFMGWVWDR